MPMFSRYDRDRLAEIIRRYLNEELPAFQFDEQLSEIAAGTKDETVKRVAHLFRCLCENGNRKWTARQAPAAVCLATFMVVVVKTGFGSHLYLATVPLGLVSMLLRRIGRPPLTGFWPTGGGWTSA
jgi:hypothetical protein